MALKEEEVSMGRTYQKGSPLAGGVLTCISNTATLLGLWDKQDMFSQNCREMGFLYMTSFPLQGLGGCKHYKTVSDGWLWRLESLTKKV